MCFMCHNRARTAVRCGSHPEVPVSRTGGGGRGGRGRGGAGEERGASAARVLQRRDACAGTRQQRQHCMKTPHETVFSFSSLCLLPQHHTHCREREREGGVMRARNQKAALDSAMYSNPVSERSSGVPSAVPAAAAVAVAASAGPEVEASVGAAAAAAARWLMT